VGAVAGAGDRLLIGRDRIFDQRMHRERRVGAERVFDVGETENVERDRGGFSLGRGNPHRGQLSIDHSIERQTLGVKNIFALVSGDQRVFGNKTMADRIEQLLRFARVALEDAQGRELGERNVQRRREHETQKHQSREPWFLKQQTTHRARNSTARVDDDEGSTVSRWLGRLVESPCCYCLAAWTVVLVRNEVSCALNSVHHDLGRSRSES
jgi:hypothetical protein